jgi:hypothetical protein
MSQEEQDQFEEDVLQIARALFAKERPFQGSGYLDSKERDGIFESSEAVVLVEATISGKADKARHDGSKLAQACIAYAKTHKYKLIKGYFVTKDEPSADQRKAIDSLGTHVVAIGFAQFRSLLVNGGDYLMARDAYAFGSARNPFNDSTTDLEEYIGIDLLEAQSSPQRTHSTKDLAAVIGGGGTVVLRGDFGAGKSMTCREIHRSLAAKYRKKDSPKFPVTLNLRDHQGQKDPDEALRRHASMVGFDSPTSLVRAWRAGYIDLILDGFDEVATTGWLSHGSDLQQIRRRSVELIRKFVDQTPIQSGVLLAGRRHFFDTPDEMVSALGVNKRAKRLVIDTDQFTEAQIAAYLGRHDINAALPSWLPSRPLLLGHLAASSILPEIAASGASLGADEGWDLLLDRVSEREARIEVGVDGHTVRRIIERLATFARGKPSGVGPLLPADLTLAFQQVCGYAPDEGSYVLLQRLPGLGEQDKTDGSRYLIDDAFTDAARAGDVARYLMSFDSEDVMTAGIGSVAPLGEVGVGVATRAARTHGVSQAHAFACARRLQDKGAEGAFSLDLLRVGLELEGDATVPRLEFVDLSLGTMYFDHLEADLGEVLFRECVVEHLDLTEYDGTPALPIFRNCLVGLVSGAGSKNVLPVGHFIDCVFEQFDPSAKTTKGILASPGLSPAEKVALTILKKIYLQSGSSRKESSLRRGLDKAHQALVSSVIETSIAEGLVVSSKSGNNVLFYPVRGLGARVRRMLEAGVASDDALLARLR